MNNESEMLLPGLESWFENTNPPKEKKIITDAKPSEWPERDIKALEDFCRKYNVEWPDCGKMPPVVALAMLKTKLGVEDPPLHERIPFGEKKAINNPYYPYLEMVRTKTILHG